MSKIRKSNSVDYIIPFVFCTIVTFLFCYFCLGASPRYLVHPSMDANAFFTTGKAMANGLTVYKDIFEQKGPFLYLIHCIAYKISSTSFLGVYIFESFALSFATFFAFKITNIFLDKRFCYFISPIFLVTILCSRCFEYGDTSEDFGFSMFMFSLYYLVLYFKKGKDIPSFVYFLSGIFAGCFAMIKFTMLGIYFGWMAVMALHTMIVKKEVKKAFGISFIFLFGMFLSIAPWFIYFYVKGGLKEFIETYFVINATLYGTNESNILQRFIHMLGSYKRNFFNSPGFGVLTFLGAVSFFLIKPFTDGKFLSRISVPLIFCCTCFFTYVGITSYKYYILILADFLLFFYIAIGLLLSKIIKENLSKSLVSIMCVISIVCCFAYIFKVNITFNKTLTLDKKESSPFYQMTEYMQSKDSTANVLCYNGLDNGIYLLGDYTPQFRFFERQNINYEKFPDNMDEQNRYINEEIADFVCVAYYNSSERPNQLGEIYENNENLKLKYSLACSKYYEPYDITYYLFENN